MDNSSLVLFKDKPVRRVWIEKEEQWYFSVVDVVKILTDSSIPKRYWSDLKKKLNTEGSKVYDKIVQLKFTASDNKKYSTDCLSTMNILRLIQSIPSPKAEPFKIWLARVGYERLKETVDPEIALNRARNNWKNLGRSEKWITQRMKGQEIRNKLTDYWSKHNVTKEKEYAFLTDIIHREWAGLTTRQHKNLKSLRQQNLRDHMSEAELLFTALAELTTTQIAKKKKR